MKKRKKKNAITLLALVITIVIMLLLAGVAIQMTMGENGLIAKSVQAQKEQAKAELYDTAKLSYMSLNAKALENGQPSPQAELALFTTEFRDKYDIVGDDIIDKKGTVIDTKLNVLNVIQGTVAGGFSSGAGSGTTTPAVYKTVGGVPILEDDKDKMILKLKILREKDRVYFKMPSGVGTSGDDPRTAVNIDFGNGIKREVTDLYNGAEMEYDPGEYIVKIERIKQISIEGNQAIRENYEIEILQWGKLLLDTVNRYEGIKINNVSKIYEPEPDKITVCYNKANFSEIPEWLFSKKVTSKKMSYFLACEKITRIPENLFKNCVNAEEFYSTFSGSRITEIPEDIFKYNTKAKLWVSTFGECTGLTSIPENLFKYNIESTYFGSVFAECTGLTSIPEDLFRHNTKIEEIRSIFYQCTGLRNIPENLFKYNTEMRKLTLIFYNCTGLTSIPENLFKYNVNVVDFERAFYNCTGLTSIPENLFKYNVNVINFESTFYNCTGLTNIPERLFDYNTSAKKFRSTFSECTRLRHIPDKIIEIAKRVKENLEFVRYMFKNCTSASNYSSIPDYMK